LAKKKKRNAAGGKKKEKSKGKVWDKVHTYKTGVERKRKKGRAGKRWKPKGWGAQDEERPVHGRLVGGDKSTRRLGEEGGPTGSMRGKRIED